MATRNIARGSTTLGTVTADDDIYLLGGSAKLVTNMDQSALTQVDTVEISNEFTGSYGTAASPFKARVGTSFYYNAAGGDAYWVSDGSASDVSPLLIMPHTTNGHLHFDTTGTITDAQIAGGQFTISTVVVVTNLYCGANSIVRFYDDSSTDPTYVRNTGAALYLDRGATTIEHGSGQTWIQGVNAKAVTTLNIWGPGVHISESGTITTLNAEGAIPCVAKLSRALTITTCNINMSIRGAEDFLNNPLLSIGTTVKNMGR